MVEPNFIFSGILNLLFDGLTCNMGGHFAYCSYFSSPLFGFTTQLANVRVSFIVFIYLYHVCICIFF